MIELRCYYSSQFTWKVCGRKLRDSVCVCVYEILSDYPVRDKNVR